jgi:hypothetical protein
VCRGKALMPFNKDGFLGIINGIDKTPKLGFQ